MEKRCIIIFVCLANFFLVFGETVQEIQSAGDVSEYEENIENKPMVKRELQSKKQISNLSTDFKTFHDSILKKLNEKYEKALPVIPIDTNTPKPEIPNRNIIDAPDGSKCPPGQRPDSNGRCRTPIW